MPNLCKSKEIVARKYLEKYVCLASLGKKVGNFFTSLKGEFLTLEITGTVRKPVRKFLEIKIS